jgi:pimeloyl-ACP methyl ester carboxylesterase
MAWYWHRVVPFIEREQQEAIAVDLPGDDPAAGLDQYVDIVAEAIGGHPNVVLVAQSLGGFTAPLVCVRVAVRALVLVNAMIPRPGETAGDWGENTGSLEARVTAARAGGYATEFDPQTYFLHDVPEAVWREGPPPREQAEAVFRKPCHFNRWPQIPIQVWASAGDRLFPLAFQRRVARERLERSVEVLPGGHLVALSHPEAVAERLLEIGAMASGRAGDSQ